VRSTALPSPGGEKELKRLASRVFAAPLNREHPLWEMWLIEGLEGDRFAVLSKTHHALVDGISGLDILSVLFADDDAERELGLMDRTTLAPYDGMAFVWDHPVETSFWMKDTLIPLTVAFWDETGRIVSILDMPPCRADPCPTYDPGTPVVGALEVPQGDLERHGVELGDSVDLVRSP
jgi:uncharacterized membrane protein (UPF0127 family)